MNRWLLAPVLAAVLALYGSGFAQDEKGTPSQKTKEAVDKLKQTPAGVAKALETLKDAVMEKIGDSFGSGQKTPSANDPLALPEKKSESPASPSYSSAGKRDPFQPLPLKTQTKRRPRENLSPLERYDLGQLQLVGIVWNSKEPRAMVEDSSGLGYVVRVGTPIGPNDGKIKEIKPNEIIIEESYIDFYGARKNRQVNMKLVKE
jgi:type IV pilus assembly protein PilP